MKNQQTIPLHALAGQWYIHLTNFPMWLKGDRTMPTFNYKIGKKNGKEGLEDQVQFIKNGREKSIKGFDTPLNEHNTAFEWRGKGWMKVLKSRWTILYFTERWAVIYFDKTLFKCSFICSGLYLRTKYPAFIFLFMVIGFYLLG